jgi:hypothetical protein
MEKYFNDELHAVNNGQLQLFGLRARIALKLIETYGSVAAKKGDEDKTGRATLDLQTPKELVDRAFDIAFYFVERAEALEELQPVALTHEQVAERVGIFERIKMDQAYKRVEKTIKEST